MGYLDSKGLQHATWVAKNYAAQNWQMTKSKEWEVSFCPAPQTELEPIVDFMFTETPPVEGSKSITNPSTITGIDVVKIGRRALNLFSLTNIPTAPTEAATGITIDVGADGTLTFNGTVNATVDGRYWILIPIPVPIIRPSGKYLHMRADVVSGSLTTTGTKDYVLVEWPEQNMTTGVINYRYIQPTNSSASHTFGIVAVGDNKTASTCNLSIYGRQTFDNYKLRVMVSISDSPDMPEYSPADTVTNEVSLGNTYYGGSLNVRTGELTATHYCVTFDGTENIAKSDEYNFYYMVGNKTPAIKPMSSYIGSSAFITTHFSTPTTDLMGMLPYTNENGTNFGWQVNLSSTWNTVSDLQTWLADQYSAGTPLTIVYELAEPLTVQLTPQQILSLPQPDKYTPRINTVYTDQKSVRVGYKRLDCIELRSDQTVHGEKTFEDSPLVPNPDNLDSQQAAPISFVKDMLRAEVEAMSGGKNTIIRDQWNNPHVMVRIPKFLLKDIDSSWPNEPHPAFIVNGVQKSEIFIGKYLASQSSSGKVQTLPRQLPWRSISYENALTASRALGNGFCLNTNASWAARALWLYKTLGGSHEYLGNNNYGRDYTYHELTGTLNGNSYIPGNTSLNDARTLTGSGGIKWNDDETEYGIADIVGNVWEWVSGFRLNGGEIQIIPNNDASLSTCDMSASSTEWKAILQDGTFVVPGTANTLKYDSTNLDSSSNVSVGDLILNTSITKSVSKGFNTMSFKNLLAVSGVIIPEILKQLALFPIGNDVQGNIWSRNAEDYFACRGGSWDYGLDTGPFAIVIRHPRTYTYRNLGFRIGFVS